jgi:putative spermidine/putrescine transport system permease protein
VADIRPARGMRRGAPGLDLAVGFVGALIFVFLVLPVVVVAVSAFNASSIPTFPPRAWTLHWFWVLFSDPSWTAAFAVSLVLVAIVTPLTTLLGTLAAYALSRLSFRGREALQAFLLSPLMIPQIVLGIGLLYFVLALGWGNSLLALIVGHMVVVLPYVVRTVSVSIFHLDPKLEAASLSLGARPFETFRRVTLPLIRPGILAGAAFAAIMSFGEVSVSLLVASATTTTLPVRIFNYVQQTFDPSVNAVACLFVLASGIGLYVLERTVGLTKAF